MIDVVLQGPFLPETNVAVNLYLDQPWVNNVIISTWYGQKVTLKDSNRIKLLLNDDVDNPGVGNRNRQIESSIAGLSIAQTDLVIKARTDQIILDLTMMHRFYEKFQDGQKLFVCGLYTAFPFHPRDHFVMGPRERVHALFDAPQDPWTGPANYQTIMRAETWLGAHYLSRFDENVALMVQRFDEYLVDGAPRLEEALALDRRLMSAYFAVFPRIDLVWPKHGLSAYHYHIGELFTEYWHDEGWE